MKKILFSFFFLLAWNSILQAQTPFYQGKTITLVAGTSAGSQYDAHARLVAQHWGEHIPGEIRTSSFKTCRAPARIAAVMTGQLDFAVVTESGKLQGEKAGLKVVLDMAKQNIPFQFTCTVTSGKMIQASPEKVMGVVKAMIEAVHYFKTHKEEAIKIMQKYTRGQERSVLEGTFEAYKELFVEDGYPTIEGLKNTLDVQASWDAKAAKAKVKDFVDLRFVKELKKTGFVDRLYGRR